MCFQGNYYVEVWDQEKRRFYALDILELDKEEALKTAEKLVEEPITECDCCCNVARVVYLSHFTSPFTLEAVYGNFYA